MTARADRAAAALVEARAWIGTPYRDGQSARGAGTDCLGLVRGCWRALRGAEPQAIAPYATGWLVTGGGERLLDGFARWLVAVDDPQPGEVIVWRIARGRPARHCGVLAPGGAIIHAHSNCAVCETAEPDPWRARRAGAFAWAA